MSRIDLGSGRSSHRCIVVVNAVVGLVRCWRYIYVSLRSGVFSWCALGLGMIHAYVDFIFEESPVE
jgi:hypothetical protein